MSKKAKISFLIFISLSIILFAISFIFMNSRKKDIQLTTINGDSKVFNNMDFVISNIYERALDEYSLNPNYKTRGVNKPVLIKTTGNEFINVDVDKEHRLVYKCNNESYRGLDKIKSKFDITDDGLVLSVFGGNIGKVKKYNLSSHFKNYDYIFGKEEFHRSWKYLDINGKSYVLLTYNKFNENKIHVNLIELEKNGNRSNIVYSKELKLSGKYSGHIYIFPMENNIVISLIYDNNNSDVYILDTDSNKISKNTALNNDVNISSQNGNIFTVFNDNKLNVYTVKDQKLLIQTYLFEKNNLKYIKTKNTGMKIPLASFLLKNNGRVEKSNPKTDKEAKKSYTDSKALLSIYSDELVYKMAKGKLIVIDKIFATVGEKRELGDSDPVFDTNARYKSNLHVYIYDIEKKKILYEGLISSIPGYTTNNLDVLEKIK